MHAYKDNVQWISNESSCSCVFMPHCLCVRACVCFSLWWVLAVCVFNNQPHTVTVRMWVWIRSSSCWDGSALCDLMLKTGTCTCVSIYLFVSVHALNKGTVHHSLHADSLILLALLSADCHCSLQAGLTSPFYRLFVCEVTPGPPDKLAVRQLASCLYSQLTEKETKQC